MQLIGSYVGRRVIWVINVCGPCPCVCRGDLWLGGLSIRVLFVLEFESIESICFHPHCHLLFLLFHECTSLLPELLPPLPLFNYSTYSNKTNFLILFHSKEKRKEGRNRHRRCHPSIISYLSYSESNRAYKRLLFFTPIQFIGECCLMETFYAHIRSCDIFSNINDECGSNETKENLSISRAYIFYVNLVQTMFVACAAAEQKRKIEVCRPWGMSVCMVYMMCGIYDVWHI